ncbi:putative quinol monooxygenase [Leuconostocaceae bacterium ESL0723]|nr:putative quinol monooxygenase [Leuconostocaceae bacterium ESL0723]
MALTVNIYYMGRGTAAQDFAREMIASGLVDQVRAQPGNLRYEYFQPWDDQETVLLIDQWTNQTALDQHHRSPMMAAIAKLRDKYGLSMRVERFESLP